MRVFSGGRLAEPVFIGLGPGDDVLVSIKNAIAEMHIDNGVVVSGIGSLSRARYHIVEPGTEKPWRDTFIEKSGTMEIVSISGIVAGGKPHLHINLSMDDCGFGGHLEEGCIVLTLAEIVVLKTTRLLTRNPGKLGLLFLAPHEEERVV